MTPRAEKGSQRPWKKSFQLVLGEKSGTTTQGRYVRRGQRLPLYTAGADVPGPAPGRAAADERGRAGAVLPRRGEAPQRVQGGARAREVHLPGRRGRPGGLRGRARHRDPAREARAAWVPRVPGDPRIAGDRAAARERGHLP